MLDTFDLVKYVSACAKNASIGVQWTDKGGVPKCDGKTIFVPKPHSGMTHEEVVTFKRAVAHETSHVRYTDFRVVQNVPMNKLEHLICNVIEDNRIDYHNDSAYEGDAVITGEHIAMTIDNINQMEKKDDVLKNKLAPLFAWDLYNREDMPLNDSLAHQAETWMDAKGKEVLSKLRKLDEHMKEVRKYTDAFKGTYATAALAKHIAKEVFGEDVEPMPSEEEVKKGGGKGEGEEKGESGGGKEKGKDTSLGEHGEELAKEMFHDHEGAGEAPSDDDGKPTGARGGVGKGAYTPSPIPVIIDRTTYVSKRPNNFARNHLKEGLSNKVRTLLQIATRNRTVYAQKKGKLNNSSLHRIPINVEGYSERVFKQRVINHSLDTAVTLLVDCSGSMNGGSKINHAAAAAAMMNHVINNVLHVDTEVLGFTEWGDDHGIYLFKKFGGKRVSMEDMVDKFTDLRLSENVDGESIMFAYNRIKTRMEARKIIFVLSDGQPAGGYSKGDIDKYTRDVIKYVEHSSVELYGIGIRHDCSKYYKHATHVDEVRNLEQHLLTVLKNTIVK